MQLNLVTPLNSIIFGDMGTRWKRNTDALFFFLKNEEIAVYMLVI